MTIFIYVFALIVSTFVSYVGCCNSLSYKKNKNVFLILSLVVIVLIVGLRGYDVGRDTVSYMKYYHNFDLINSIKLYHEPAFTFITYLLNKINAQDYIFNIILAIITVAFFYFYFKNNKYFYWFVFYLYTSGFLFFMMNGVRQSIAFSIFLFSLKYVHSGNIIKFIFILVLSSMFHYSAILLFPVYFVRFLSDIKYPFLIAMCILSFFISPFGIIEGTSSYLSLLPKNYGSYLYKMNLKETKFSLGFLFYNFLNFYIIYLKSKITFNDYNRIIFNLYFIGILFVNLTWESVVLQRYNIYLLYLQIPVMSYISYKLRKKHDILLFALVYMFIFSFIYKIIVSDSGCSPYNFIF